MKKIVGFIGLILLVVTLWVSIGYAAGSCVLSKEIDQVGVMGNVQRKYITLTCTGDGSIAAYTFNPRTYGVRGWYLYNITTDPGSSAPTDNYDITLMVNGEDVAGGLLADRSTSVTQTKAISASGIGFPMMDSNMLITFANETASPSTIVMTLRFTAN